MTQALIEKMAEAMRNAVAGTSVGWDEMALAAFTAISDAGFVVVPREPTGAMTQAAHHCLADDNGDVSDAYHAMIAQAEKEG